MWSLSAPLPNGVEVDSHLPKHVGEATVGTDDTQESPAVESQRRDPDLADVPPTSPDSSGEGETGDNLSQILESDTDPTDRPIVGSAGDIVTGDTTAVDEIAAQASEQAAPSAVQTPVENPSTPSLENTPVVSTESAALPVETVPEAKPSAGEVGAEREQALLQTTDEAEAEGVSRNEAGSAAVPGAQLVTTTDGPAIGQAPEETALPQLSIGEASPPSLPNVALEGEEAAAGPEETSDADLAVAGETEGAGEGDPSADQPATEEPIVTSRIGTKVVPLTERDDEGPASSILGGDQAEELPPFEANAAEFSLEGDRPVMSIILIDDENGFGAEALAEFPYPLSFAIDPADPAAQEKMERWRAAGFEVLILADLPQDAAPQDAETSFAVWQNALPKAVAVLEGVKTGFQGNRALADQMSLLLQDTGYGMVTQNNGLNTVQKLALRDGMPAGVVFRDFDGAGQNPRAIRRFLDQAAFRARQEGAVIMLGRLQPDTVSALLLWGLQDRAAQVNLAPVSAGLKAKMSGEQGQ
ncbi:hypothetical protein RSK20926_19612 [Roseobacter sp. SK209-2-6]|nr:hypothetical protein RSK20926_19612 [Roseobacter sp. SK209-2-6]